MFKRIVRIGVLAIPIGCIPSTKYSEILRQAADVLDNAVAQGIPIDPTYREKQVVSALLVPPDHARSQTITET